MITKCLDCNKSLTGEGDGDEQIPSGLCDICWKKSCNEEDGLDELLDEFDDEEEMEENL